MPDADDEQTEYTVTWQIEVHADSREEAALQAWGAMRAPDSTANVFDVAPFGEPHDKVQIDLEQFYDANDLA